MDAKRTVSLEAFKTAHCDEGMEDTEEESEAEEDWSLDDERKRKGKGKEPAHKVKSSKKAKPVDEEELDWVSSAKIEKLCEILDRIRANDPSEKVIVFSQFTAFLDIISPALRERNYTFGRVFLFEGRINCSMTEACLHVNVKRSSRVLKRIPSRLSAWFHSVLVLTVLTLLALLNASSWILSGIRLSKIKR